MDVSRGSPRPIVLPPRVVNLLYWGTCVSPNMPSATPRAPRAMKRPACWPILCLAIAACAACAAGAERDYRFERTISRPVLENYLSRSITMMDLLARSGELDENLRMLRNVGAKFAGRAVYVWGGERRLPELLGTARENAARVHRADPDMILQAGAFEIVTRDAEQLPVPARVFEALGEKPQERSFRYEDMLYPDGRLRDHWRRGASVPDVSRPETRRWFVYLGMAYIDAGVEAIHFGQVELMGQNDRRHEGWQQVLDAVRRHAAAHARRGLVLCDGHVPGGGLVRDGRLLLDFHSFPLRIVEVRDRPQEGILRTGAADAIYGRSRGGRAPSGWQCEHLPYLVELDNWSASPHPGQFGVPGFIWGYDEIGWFAHQPEAYRNRWLRYAHDWVRQHDPAGHLQMPGARCLHTPVGRQSWYRANTPSPAAPDGFGQEETIKAIWAGE